MPCPYSLFWTQVQTREFEVGPDGIVAGPSFSYVDVLSSVGGRRLLPQTVNYIPPFQDAEGFTTVASTNLLVKQKSNTISPNVVTMTEPYSEVQMFPLLEELASVVDEPENQQDDIVEL